MTKNVLDIVDRIENAIQFTECTNTVDLFHDAIEEIERLRAEKIEPCSGCTDYRRFSRMED